MKRLWYLIQHYLNPPTIETTLDQSWYWVNYLRRSDPNLPKTWTRSQLRTTEIETRFQYLSHYLLYLNRLKLALSQSNPNQNPPQSYQDLTSVTLDEYCMDSEDYPLDLTRALEQVRDLMEDILVLIREAPESVYLAYESKVEIVQTEWLSLCTVLYGHRHP